MSEEREFDITLRARVEGADDVEALRKRYAQLKEEIADLRANPFPRGLYTNERGMTDYRESSGTMVAQKLVERTALGRQLGMFPPRLPKVEEIKPEQVAAAEKKLPTLSDMIHNGARAANNVLGVVGLDGMGANVSQGARVATMALGTYTPAIVAAGAATAAAVVSVGLLAMRMAEGARDAAKMAKELDGLGDTDRAQRVRELGKLGEVLERNSALLLEYGRNSEHASSKVSDFFTAAGTQLVPILNEVAKAIDSIDAVGLGEKFGRMAVMVTQAATPIFSFIEAYNRLPDPIKKTIQSSTVSLINPAAGLTMAALNYLPDPNKAKEAEAEADRRARLSKEWTADLDLARKDARDGQQMLPWERSEPFSRLKLLDKRRDQLVEQISSATNLDGSLMTAGQMQEAKKKVMGLDSSIFSLSNQVEDATSSAKFDTRLNNAKLRGDSDTVRQLEYIKEYQALLGKGVMPDQAEQLAVSTDALRHRESLQVSGLAARGGSMGESAAAAMANQNFLNLTQQTQRLVDEARQERIAVGQILSALLSGRIEVAATYQK